ncbi:uncharacterized protein LOC121775751 isoform X1 [Salvia splendens]|uniref:uncharacterized protein LOC121775751 isoform X1 n=1 Tax=Salvia splendens TaxID=180675 RepID=UPI001C26DC07|nr:uncharacterized protein LOC121775751 isoform X1 [Salvia splendens]
MEAERRIGERLIEEAERRIGERLFELVQRQEKIDARCDKMLKAVTAIKDRLQGSGGATAMVDVESSHESLVEEDDPIVQLRSLKQVSHVRSYIEAFATLNSKAGIQEDQALSLFVSGLVDEIRVPVCLFKPKTLDEAYALSKLQELTLTGVFWCDREESNLRRNEKLDVNSKVEGLKYEFDEFSEFADIMETDKEASEGVSSGSDEGGDGLVDFGNSLNFFLHDVKAGKRLNHDKMKETELGPHVTDFSEYNTFSEENKLKEVEFVPSVRQIATVRDIAVTLNVVSNLTRRPVRFPKPLVKMKFTAQYDEEMGGKGNVQWASAMTGENRIHVLVLKELGWLFNGDYDAFGVNKICEEESEELKEMRHGETESGKTYGKKRMRRGFVVTGDRNREEKAATSQLTEWVTVPLVGRVKVDLLCDIGWLVRKWFIKPKVKMKMKEVELGNLIATSTLEFGEGMKTGPWLQSSLILTFHLGGSYFALFLPTMTCFLPSLRTRKLNGGEY